MSDLLEVGKFSFNLPLEGRHNAKNLLLALAVAKELNIPWQPLKKMSVELPVGRGRRLVMGGVTVLDETYNASPEAVLAALEHLAIQPGHRYAVLGTMYELGSQSIALHRCVAEKAVSLGLDGLILVVSGPEAEAMSLAAKPMQRFLTVKDYKEVVLHLKKWLVKGDVVLIKGSRKIGLDRLLESLQED